ncbi:MAG: hypothetical protein ACYCQJ_03395 [Nitrososphaerales archaeon]
MKESTKLHIESLRAKWLTNDINSLRLIQFVVCSAIITVLIEQMIFYDVGGNIIIIAAYNVLYARIMNTVIDIGIGAHYYVVIGFMIMFFLYIIFDKSTILELPLIGIIFYTFHEGIFNLFFLTYNQRLPPLYFQLWYHVFYLVILGSCSTLAMIFLFPRTFLRKSTFNLSQYLWSALLILTCVWILVGFPVTANIFHNATISTIDNLNPVANAFEFVWNLVFFAAFYCTFKFSDISAHLVKEFSHLKSGLTSTRLEKTYLNR